jgi:hypothetical protein
MTSGYEDPRAHYAVQVTDLPPSEIRCKCGQWFREDDVLAAMKAHMDELNGEAP